MLGSRIAGLTLAGLLAASIFTSTALHAAVAPTFIAGNATIEPGTTFDLSFTVKDFTADTGFAFSLAWDSGVLQYMSLGNLGMGSVSGQFNQLSTSSGKLAFAWDPSSGNPETYSDGTTMFTIQFKAIGADGSQSAINFTDDPTIRFDSVNFAGTDFLSQSGIVTITAVPEPVTSALCAFAGLFCGLKLLRWGRSRIRL